MLGIGLVQELQGLVVKGKSCDVVLTKGHLLRERRESQAQQGMIYPSRPRAPPDFVSNARVQHRVALESGHGYY